MGTQDAGRCPLSDLYQPYDFGDTEGPGCGVEEHDDACLCDVIVTNPVTIDPHYGASGYARIATQVHGGTPHNPADFVGWASELLGAFEAVNSMGSRLPAYLDEVSGKYHMARQEGKGRYVGQAEVRQLLAEGLSLTQSAEALGVPLHEVTRLFTQKDLPTDRVLEAERMLRSGEHESCTPIADATGLSRHTVRRLALALGVTLAIAQRTAEGGGLKYTAAQYEQVLTMRSQGASYGQIAKATGVLYNSVVGMCRRRKAAAA